MAQNESEQDWRMNEPSRFPSAALQEIAFSYMSMGSIGAVGIIMAILRAMAR
jgi:hypothetical protein